MTKIGFSNLDERNAFAREMREHLEREVARHDGIELIVRDNRHDTEQAIANVNDFADLGVDVAIIYHIDERAGMSLAMPLRQRRIPIISVEFSLPMTVFIGIDNDAAGQMSGRQGGKWIRNNWSGQLDEIKTAILTDQRVISSHRDRFHAALAALEAEIFFHGIDPQWTDSGTESDMAAERFADLLQYWESEHHIAVITMGDVVSRGVIEAARAVGREEDIMVMSFDGTAWARDEFEKPFSRLIVSPYFNLEHYCQQMLELALICAKNETVPPKTLIQPVLLARA